MENVKKFFEQLDNTLLSAFYRAAGHNGGLAAIYQRQTQTWIVEITRDVAVHLLNSITKLAVINNLTVNVDTTVDENNGRFVAKCSLIISTDKPIISFTSFGEGTETVVLQKTGEVIGNENAVRTAETRAIKRVVEMLSPIIGVHLRIISQKLQKDIATIQGNISYQSVNEKMLKIVSYMKQQWLKKQQSKKTENPQITTKTEMSNNTSDVEQHKKEEKTPQETINNTLDKSSNYQPADYQKKNGLDLLYILKSAKEDDDDEWSDIVFVDYI